MNKTDWFSEQITPVRVGVYEVDDKGDGKGNWFAYWDGYEFCYRSYGIEFAYEMRLCGTVLPPRTKWRGLKRRPK